MAYRTPYKGRKGKYTPKQKGRVGKKKGYRPGKSSANSSLKRWFREEARRALKSPGQKNTLTAFPESMPIHRSTGDRSRCYFRVPVTEAIPIQQLVMNGIMAPPDDRRCKSNCILLSGVRVRMMIEHAEAIDIAGVCYPAKVQPKKICSEGAPTNNFTFGCKDEETCRLLNLEETCFTQSKDGPLALLNTSTGLVLDSVDQSMSHCRLSKGSGAPISEAQWKVGRHGPDRKGRKFSEELGVSPVLGIPPDSLKGKGHQQTDVQHIEVYWELNKKVEFKSDMESSLLFKSPLEIMFEVRHLSDAQSRKYEYMAELGVIYNVMVDVYYSSI